ncbi:hypothetical protein H5410_021395 [Solanum commersonii]|uniref:Uncharacterized protein n=1 Tax=Solanum commersonii TaxID=4109 RepID=A0A9J5ZBV1_SOLCO|nr:hypothetical protein H5410_021395 [Solanum commersonii]
MLGHSSKPWCHISKVRSITLDVRVWEPTILDLFRTLGNSYCNSMWEKLVQLPSEGFNVKGPLPAKKRLNVERYQRSQNSNLTPSLKDAFHEKEKYILAKATLLSVANKASLNSKVMLLLGTPGKVFLKVQKCSLLSKATLFASLGYTLLGWT